MMDYKAAGVDIDAGNETVRRIRGLARSTFTSGVLSEIGSFGGLFQGMIGKKFVLEILSAVRPLKEIAAIPKAIGSLIRASKRIFV